MGINKRSMWIPIDQTIFFRSASQSCRLGQSLRLARPPKQAAMAVLSFDALLSPAETWHRVVTVKQKNYTCFDTLKEWVFSWAVCRYIYLSVCLSVYLSIHPSIHLYIPMHRTLEPIEVDIQDWPSLVFIIIWEACFPHKHTQMHIYIYMIIYI